MPIPYSSWINLSWKTPPSKLVDSVRKKEWRRCRFIYPVGLDVFLGKTVEEEGGGKGAFCEDS